MDAGVNGFTPAKEKTVADDSGNNAQGKAPVEQPEDPAWLVEDRAWFEAHPDRIFRLRPYVRGELSPTPGAKILEPSAVIDQLKVVADCAAAEDAILSEIRRIGARPATAVLRIDPDGGARMRGLVSEIGRASC